MTTDTVNTAAKYIIALVAVIGCFILIYSGHDAVSGNVQEWAILTLIIGWLIRDSAANASTANVSKIIAATTGGAAAPGTATATDTVSLG